MSTARHERTTQSLAEYCKRVLDLKNAKLNDEYFYQSLPLCVLDAVFSIGVRYEGTKRTVKRYCDHFGVPRIRDDKANLPPRSNQESISAFLAKVDSIGIIKFTEEVLLNRQRTSSVSGILKSEATLLFARILKWRGVEYLQDVPALISDDEFEGKIKAVPGQGSGLSLRYFFMLAGSDHFVKPDRHIRDFIRDGTGEDPSLDCAQHLLSQVTMRLKPTHRHLTPRLLDNVIWNFQRGVKSGTRNKGVQLKHDPRPTPVGPRTAKAGLNKHRGHIELEHSFQMVWDYVRERRKVSLTTEAGTSFESGGSIARHDRPVIRFFQKGIEYARVYRCCWGFYWNCFGTRVGMYCKALDLHLRENQLR